MWPLQRQRQGGMCPAITRSLKIQNKILEKNVEKKVLEKEYFEIKIH